MCVHVHDVFIYLSSGELPVERALGVQWNRNEDTFSFKIAVEEKPYLLFVAFNFELSLQSLRHGCTIHSRKTYYHLKTIQKSSVWNEQYCEGQKIN